MSRDLPRMFRNFAGSEARETSPLYHALSLSIAEDNEILTIADRASPGQPVPNLLFGAVQYLLARDESDDLRCYYPVFAGEAQSHLEVYPSFRGFVLKHRQEIIALLRSRRVQTNEVRRCAYLFPAILLSAMHFPEKPIALVEIGTSAGLNLLPDQYRYSYGDAETYGKDRSPLHIQSSFVGHKPSVLKSSFPKVFRRIGIDTDIVDPTIEDQVAWLMALIWPEHRERRKMLETALAIRLGFDLDLREGDGFMMINEIVDEIPEDIVPFIYHTHVANQIPEEARNSFVDQIHAMGQRRDVAHFCNNIKPTLHLTLFREGSPYDTALASVDGHGRSIQWLLKD